MAQNKHPHP